MTVAILFIVGAAAILILMTKEEIIATVRGNNHVVVWLTEEVAYLYIPFDAPRVLWNKPEAAVELVKKMVSELGLSIDDVLFVEGLNGIAALHVEWDGSDTFLCEDPNCKVAHSADQLRADTIRSFSLGCRANEAGAYEKAVDAFRETIRLQPDNLYARFLLGSAYDSLGRHHQAIKAYQEVICSKARSPSDWFILSGAYDSLGKHDQALKALQEVVRSEPIRVSERRLVQQVSKWLEDNYRGGTQGHKNFSFPKEWRSKFTT